MKKWFGWIGWMNGLALAGLAGLPELNQTEENQKAKLCAAAMPANGSAHKGLLADACAVRAPGQVAAACHSGCPEVQAPPEAGVDLFTIKKA